MPSYATPKTLISDLSRAVIAAAGHRRQAVGIKEGDRAQPSIAADRATLGIEWDGAELLTLPGKRTAKRAQPMAIAKLLPGDPCRQALATYLHAHEQIGSVRGAPLSGLPTSASTASPENASLARTRLARIIEETHRAIEPNRVVLQTKRTAAQTIRRLDLFQSVVIEGRSMSEILRRAAWTPHATYLKRLSEDFEAMIAPLHTHLRKRGLLER